MTRDRNRDSQRDLIQDFLWIELFKKEKGSMRGLMTDLQLSINNLFTVSLEL